MIEKITHDNPVTEAKVNFFAAYYNFASAKKGKSHMIPVDNPLSLIEKAIFQIKNNPVYCGKYLSTFLDHSLLRANNKLINRYQTFKEFKIEFRKYRKGNLTGRAVMIQSHDFIVMLEKLQAELKEKMFDDGLNELIEMLGCNHELEKHKNDIIALTNLLVTEFTFQSRSESDIRKILSVLFSNSIDEFPMPEHLKNADDEVKKEYVSNRTFEQQFKGILDRFNEPQTKSYFIFNVSKINVPDDFEFVYDRVIFYSKKHPKVSLVVTKFQEFYADYFDNIGLLAVIESGYHTLNIASFDVLNPIKAAVQFLNIRLDISCYLEPHKFLVTPDFINFGFSGNGKSHDYVFREKSDKDRLLDNPYALLKDCGEFSKAKFLAHEKIFVDAFELKSPTKYWQYLEAIIPTQFLQMTVIDAVVKILLLNAESYYRNHVNKGYLFRAVSIANFNAPALGITSQIQLTLLREEGKEIERIKENIKIPFVKYLLKEHERKFAVKDIHACESYLTKVLNETKAERNSDVHSGINNIKSIITLNESLGVLVLRLRWLIIERIQLKNGQSYEDIIRQLVQNGDLLRRGGCANLVYTLSTIACFS